jgi:hypothetical protein
MAYILNSDHVHKTAHSGILSLGDVTHACNEAIVFAVALPGGFLTPSFFPTTQN